MAISSLSGAEYVGVKVFLYKYSPFFNYIGGDTKNAQTSQSTGILSPSSDAVNVFNAMIANINSFLTITDAVINSKDVQNGAYTVTEPINPVNIQNLLNKYAPIINSLNHGGYIFTSDIVNSQGVSTSLNNLNNGTIVTQTTAPSVITSLVLTSLAGSTTPPPTGLASYFVIPEQQSTASPAAQFSGFTAPWYGLLVNFFNGPQGSNQFTSTLAMQPAMSAWIQHARTLNSYLKFIQNYATTLAGAGTTSSSANQTQVEQPFKIIQYQIELNASKYFSKFDITQFVKSYSFNQGLYGGDLSWTVNLQDVIIPFAQLSPSSTTPTIRKTSKFYDANGNLVVEALGPACRSSNGVIPKDDLVTLMAQYESEDTYNVTFDKEVSVIQQAFLTRGKGGVPYQSTYQTQFQEANTSNFGTPPPDVTNQPSGIRLSDLLQKYNFISVFVYKSSVSFENAKEALFPNGVPTSVATQESSGTFNVPFDDSNEVHLMLAGFKNEFNGFIVNKSRNQTQGQVDQVTIEGNGVLRLFSDTMTIFDPSPFAGGYYGAAVLNVVTPNTSDPTTTNESIPNFFTAYENKFQGQNPVQIISQLLKLVYGVDFSLKVTGFNLQPTNFVELPKSSTPLFELQGFYNFYNLESRQGNPIIPALATPSEDQTALNGNLFAIGPFLLACVMALRNYNYNLNNPSAGAATTGQTGITFKGSNSSQNTEPDTAFLQVNPKNLVSSNFAEEFGGPMAQIFYETAEFIPYFAMIRQSFDQWVTKFKTPHDIMDEVCKMSFLEFYERPNGRIILRTPQYNQISRILLNGNTDASGNLLQSSKFNVISANYGEDSSQLKTQRRGSYRTHFLPSGNGFQAIMPSYGSGKLMAQYGFREGTVEANPVLSPNNFGTQPTQGINNNSSNLNVQDLLSKYVRFILEYENAELRVGSLSLDGDPALEVGKMFYDVKNNKIGYIIGVKKDLSVGQTYTASIQLKFVRDASLSVSGNSVSADFRILPTLEELVTSTGTFQLGAPATPTIEFNSIPAPVANNTTLQSINANLIKGLGTGPYIGGLGI